MIKDTKFTRFDAVILGSTFLTSFFTFIIYIGFTIFKYIKQGVWIKSLTACEVFNIFCSDGSFLHFIGNIEAILFVSIIFFFYFLIHLYLTRR